MREIKFRTWNGKEIEYFTLDNNFDCVSGWLDGKILMQYTGLKDKNGLGNICLYEGDVLSLSGEIIGNIYENREILKDKTNFVIEKIGTKAWRNTEKKAMDRGYGYAI